MTRAFNRVMLIANPASQNGRGDALARKAYTKLQEMLPPDSVDLVATTHPRHAVALAASADGFDTIITLGGDGVIHETLNGIMRIPQERRPRLGIIPAGSGNDFAHTLAMSEKLPEALKQLTEAEPVSIDVGQCNDIYYTETVSFGLDAAIALDTMERRVRTGKTGTRLYLAAGLDQLMNHLNVYDYEARFDGSPEQSGQMYLFAVQNGSYYGGGFKVAPEASICDGKLDIVIAHPKLSRVQAMGIFMLAKNGHHTKFKKLEFRRVESLDIQFEAPLPAQIDGERLEGTQFHIRVVPKAVQVLIPRNSA